MEHQGDTITHQIISLLHRTFVTPFDREDIALLAHTMDDIMDYIHSAADAMFIYKIKEPKDRAKELADIIVQGATELEKAVTGLRKRSELKNMQESCVEINRLENMADRIYRAAMAELFDNTEDITELIKWREIYEHMEAATDRCEDVANVLEGVALKHA
jgi:predicted phosphate transport protein (TIGR00153 family)